VALSVSQTKALALILKPGMRVCSMGYPDLIAPFHYFEQMLGDKVHALEYREDSKAICARHGLGDIAIPDAQSFFKLMDCELDVYDIVKERGGEIICDLNIPFGWRESINTSQSMRQKYDVVLDVGTVEHCFNISQAIMNMASLVKVGGYIIHENPHSGWTNHGFFSLHPTLFYDFYTSNGFEIVNLVLTTRNGDQYECHPTKRMNIGDLRDVNIFCLAKRVEDVTFRFPTQSKYLKMTQ